MASPTKETLIAYLVAHNLVCDGTETHAELSDAYRFLREHERMQTALSNLKDAA